MVCHQKSCPTFNGKQFTGRFTKPRPSEVLFERVCRENGITAKLTRPYSPTTTGKIERWHRTLRRELLDTVGSFPDLPTAQAAITSWVHTYNHDRPHQSLDMAVPAKLFRPNDSRPIGALAPSPAGSLETPLSAPSPVSEPAPPVAVSTAPTAFAAYQSAAAVEFDTVINASGMLNIIPRIQRIRIGSPGQHAHVWADEFSIHIVIDGRLVKTSPSKLDADNLAELRMRGAQPAGPPPVDAVAVTQPKPWQAVEFERRVDGDGAVEVARTRLKIGSQWANRHITLRLDDRLIHVITDGVVVKTMPSPLTAGQYGRISGARPVTTELPPAATGPISVQRRVPAGGVVMVTRQRLRIGNIHVGKTVTILVEDTHFRVVHNGEELSLHPRREQRAVTRWREQPPRPRA